MFLQEKHDILHFLLLKPRLGDHLYPLISDTFDLDQQFHIILDHGKGVHAETLYDLLSKLRSHTLDQSGAQILLHTVYGRRQGFLPVLRYELPAVFRIDLPVSFHQKNRSDIRIQQIPYYRYQIAVILHPAFQDRVPVLRVLVCDPFHYTAYLSHSETLPPILSAHLPTK